MNVGELIEELKKVDPEIPVYVRDTGDDFRWYIYECCGINVDQWEDFDDVVALTLSETKTFIGNDAWRNEK